LQASRLRASSSATDAAPSVDQQADAAFVRALYGPHPYAREAQPSDLAGVTADQVRAWLPKLHNPANAFLVVVGDFEEQRALDAVRAWFGGWKRRPEHRELPAPVPGSPTGPPRETVLVHHRGGAAQTSVSFGCRLPTADLRGTAINRAFASALARHFFTRVRHEAGLPTP
jgi:zinc protease